MSPLELAICRGEKDDKLDTIITGLQAMEKDGGLYLIETAVLQAAIDRREALLVTGVKKSDT